MSPLTADVTVERHDIRVRLRLDHNPMVAGERTWATVTIRNIGRRTAHFMTDGCASTAEVSGILQGDWVGGVPQDGIAADYKAFALEPFGHAGVSYLGFGFRDERFLGVERSCADLGLTHDLDPGERLVHRAAWDGALGREDGVLGPPDGPVRVVASFPYVSDSMAGATQPIDAELDAWIVGGTPFPFMTPAAAIDAALADEAFLDWLRRAPRSTWINTTRTLDPVKGTWAIGLFRDTLDGSGFFGLVTLDARTGEIVAHRFE